MKSVNLLSRLLRKNTSAARVAGFVISNFIGIAIVLAAIQFYCDARPLLDDRDSFIKTDWLVINKKVTSGNTLGLTAVGFSPAEIEDIKRQPWVRGVAPFISNDYRVRAEIAGGAHSLSTDMFFESLPDDYVDVPPAQWSYRKGSMEVPIIISKEYLALYNFGFASGAGLPRMSEGIMSGIPLRLHLSSDDGTRRLEAVGRVAGFSNRLNTILVPENFMEEANEALGTGCMREPSRVIIDVSRPGDVAINEYLEARDLEAAGDKRNSGAAFLLRLVTGIIAGVGGLITLLSLAILFLSISLIMEKNRQTIHSLLMLGYATSTVGGPYSRLAVTAGAGALLLAYGSVFLLREYYLSPLRGLGAEPGSVLPMLAVGLGLTLLTIGINLAGIRRRVRGSWRL